MRIPNYFLPQDDMEKSMKQLHYNYNNVRSTQESGEPQKQHQQNVKIQLNSTTLLIQNQKVLKQDINRINKIFRSKNNS